MTQLFPRLLWVAVALLGQPVVLTAQEGVWLDVPFVKQEKNLCGAASVSMILRYWEKAHREAPACESFPIPAAPTFSEIAAALRPSQTKGISGNQMRDYLTSQGYQTFVFKGSWADLENHLSKGRPLIVGLGNKGELDHFVVVAGHNPSEATVLINDPARRKLLKMSRDDFEKAWKKTGSWTLLAVPANLSTRVPSPPHAR